MILAVIAAMALLVFAGSGLTETVYHDVGKYEIIDLWVLNQCTGEWFTANGIIHYNTQLVVDSAGGEHWKYHANHNLRGFNQITGKKYQVISTVTLHENRKGDFPYAPYEWTFVNTSPLISQGEETNMIFRIRNHVAINANGDVTVSFSDVEIVCRG